MNQENNCESLQSHLRINAFFPVLKVKWTMKTSFALTIMVTRIQKEANIGSIVIMAIASAKKARGILLRNAIVV